jgi:microsomal prostaglandin-E synthase 2
MLITRASSLAFGVVRISPRTLSSGQTLAAGDIPSIQLYQYAICPFCHKVKALLAYSGLKYEIIEVNPLNKAEIKWSKDYKKVPIAKLDGTSLLGSDEIMKGILEDSRIASNLEKRWDGRMTMARFQHKDTKKWVDFANDELSSLLYPNICRTVGDAYAAFGYVNEVESFSPFQRVAIRSIGSLAMYFAASRVKKKRRITDEQQALNLLLDRFEKEGLKNGDSFLSGADEPNLGDLAIYGTLRSIEGLPVHDRLIRERGGNMGRWYDRVAAIVVN